MLLNKYENAKAVNCDFTAFNIKVKGDFALIFILYLYNNIKLCQDNDEFVSYLLTMKIAVTNIVITALLEGLYIQVFSKI